MSKILKNIFTKISKNKVQNPDTQTSWMDAIDACIDAVRYAENIDCHNSGCYKEATEASIGMTRLFKITKEQDGYDFTLYSVDGPDIDIHIKEGTIEYKKIVGLLACCEERHNKNIEKEQKELLTKKQLILNMAVKRIQTLCKS